MSDQSLHNVSACLIMCVFMMCLSVWASARFGGFGRASCLSVSDHSPNRSTVGVLLQKKTNRTRWWAHRVGLGAHRAPSCVYSCAPLHVSSCAPSCVSACPCVSACYSECVSLVLRCCWTRRLGLGVGRVFESLCVSLHVFLHVFLIDWFDLLALFRVYAGIIFPKNENNSDFDAILQDQNIKIELEISFVSVPCKHTKCPTGT